MKPRHELPTVGFTEGQLAAAHAAANAEATLKTYKI